MFSLRGIVSDLMFTNSLLRQRIKKLESGETFSALKKRFKQTLDAEIRKNHELKKEIENLHKRIAKIHSMWQQVIDDLFDEIKQIKEKHKVEMEKKQEEVWAAQRQRDEALDKARDRAKELYEVKVKLEETEGRVQQLTVSAKKDHTNSSKPSSVNPNHGKIPNGRVPTGKKPGGQTGHPHHPRKRQEPNDIVQLPEPEAFKNRLRYKPLDDYEIRQLQSVNISVQVTDYVARKYKDLATGKTVYANFPDGVDNDVNYDGSIKALAYLLNNDCNVSIGKTQEFLKRVSKGKIDIATGTICKLVKEFSDKSKPDRDGIINDLKSQPILHADFTFNRVKSKQGTILIVCAPDGTVLFQAKEKKGKEGIKDSPLENYDGVVVSDHEAVFVKCGRLHQECMSHVTRYTIGSIQNEQNLTWNKLMGEWIKKAIHYHNEVNNRGAPYDPAIVQKLLEEYRTIMAKAQEEYDYEPPAKYYTEGFNLFKRLRDNMDDHVLFLLDTSVPPTNNIAERNARVVKRKSHQVMVRRSTEYDEYYCDGLSVMRTLKAKGADLYKSLTVIFNRQSGCEV